jgi:hypothetical protein
LLCHCLNEIGQKAYLIIGDNDPLVNPALNTPLCKSEIFYFHMQSGYDPVVIYPDIVRGNPLLAKKVVRWLLAPAGAYGGDKTFPETDKVYGYTKDIAEPVLCLPTFDPNIFYPPGVGETCLGNCFYAHKYDKLHGNKLLPLTEGMTRCEGTPQEVASILRKHEKCYVYERSEILVTAAMCGCKIVPVITSYWDGSIPEEFFEDEIPVSVKTLQERFEVQLNEFIRDTQEWARKK